MLGCLGVAGTYIGLGLCVGRGTHPWGWEVRALSVSIDSINGTHIHTHLLVSTDPRGLRVPLGRHSVVRVLSGSGSRGKGGGFGLMGWRTN